MSGNQLGVSRHALIAFEIIARISINGEKNVNLLLQHTHVAESELSAHILKYKKQKQRHLILK